MKHLIYFLLFTTAVFSQNYQYSIEEASNKSTLKAAVVNNQLEEIEYFKAYLLPISKKATLQAALKTYGSVRLEKGDYSGVDIEMSSNQRLYGHPSLTKISNIKIKAGSTNVLLENLLPASRTITLEAGGVISGCTFKSIKWASLIGTNIMLANNSFINFGGPIRIDCSQSGYFRNNKIIKNQSGTVSNLLVLKGNSTTPSYGNVHLHTNFLQPHGDTSDIAGLQSATFVGIDAEGWNLEGEGTKAMFSAKNMGNVKITNFGGGNNYSKIKTPSFDIDANEVFFLDKILQSPTSVLSLKTNMFLINGRGTYTRNKGTLTGYDLLGNLDFSEAIKYNGVAQISLMTDKTTITKLSNTIIGTQYTPWSRPNWETLPDPLGTNWKTDRIGKPDQTAYLQKLLDNTNIVDLPEGIFYISSTLKLRTEQNILHGITGQGTGKTVIVGLKDDFPLISLIGSKSTRFVLSNLTLQGGREGIYASQDYGQLNIAYQNMSFVVFRNQMYGIHLKKTGGFDNCFLENIGFINCSIGFYQEPTAGSAVEGNSSYVDKTMFYKNQFINCDTGISMLATRVDNMDAWVDCKFDKGKIALNLAAQSRPIIANCDFTNYNGVNVIKSNTISMYNSNVYNNNTTGSTISSVVTNIEGCKFLDSAPMFSPIVSNTQINHIVNSIITGNVVTKIPAGLGFRLENAIYVNSTLLSNPTLNKLLVNVKLGVPTVIINTTPKPYPQILVTQ